MAPEIKADVTLIDNAPLAGASRSDESVTEDVPDFGEPEGGEPQPEVSTEKEKTKTPAGEGEKVVAAKVVYTPEELETLLQSESDVDTSRLSAEGKVLMKSFQRGNEKKFQELAEMRKAIQAQPKPGSGDPREDLFSEYVHDPAGVVRKINAEIERQEGIDPTDAKYAVARQTIVRLQALKDEFSVRRQSIIEHGQQVDNIVSNTQIEIKKAIPDFDVKAEKLTEFAVDLGFTIEEVRALTDPTVVGLMALKMTKAINAAYDKLNAPKTAEGKVKKDAPAPLQRGVSSKILEKKDDDNDPGMKPMGEYLAWRKKHIAG